MRWLGSAQDDVRIERKEEEANNDGIASHTPKKPYRESRSERKYRTHYAKDADSPRSISVFIRSF